MRTVKQILDNYFLSFIEENGLESLKEEMIETITKAEYKLDDLIDDKIEDIESNSCDNLEDEIEYLEYEIKELNDELKKKDKFFEPKTLQDEIKIQWVKDNWDKIPIFRKRYFTR
jgi:hypothetical protein